MAGWKATILLALLATSVAAQEVRVNAGGGPYTEAGGRAWAATHGFSGGTAFDSPGLVIDDTSDDELYQSGILCDSSCGWSATVPSGIYRVRLLWAETQSSSPGRTFNVIDGQSRIIVSNLDVLARAGAYRTAYERSLLLTVPGTNLDLTFAAVGGPAFINAIEIIRVGAFISGNVNPTTCGEGEFFYNTTDDQLKICTATDTWTAVGTGGSIAGSTTLPATCAPPELYIDTDAQSGKRVYLCESTNTWVQQGTMTVAEVDADPTLHGVHWLAVNSATGLRIDNPFGAGVAQLGLILDGSTLTQSASGIRVNTGYNAPTASALVSNPAALTSGKYCKDAAADGTCEVEGDLDDLDGTVDASQVDLADDYDWTGKHSYGSGPALIELEEGAAPGAGASAGIHNFYVDSSTNRLATHENGGSVVNYAALADLASYATLAGAETFATGLKTVTAKFDFGGGALEIPNGTSLPGTCAIGDIYMDTDATSGQRLYLCESANTWKLQGDGGEGGGGGSTNAYLFQFTLGGTSGINGWGHANIMEGFSCEVCSIGGGTSLHNSSLTFQDTDAEIAYLRVGRIGADVDLENITIELEGASDNDTDTGAIEVEVSFACPDAEFNLNQAPTALSWGATDQVAATKAGATAIALMLLSNGGGHDISGTCAAGDMLFVRFELDDDESNSVAGFRMFSGRAFSPPAGGGGGEYTADGEGIEETSGEFSLELDGSTLVKSATGLKVSDSYNAPTATALAANPAATGSSYCSDRNADGSCAAQGDLDDLQGAIATSQIEEAAVTTDKLADGGDVPVSGDVLTVHSTTTEIRYTAQSGIAAGTAAALASNPAALTAGSYCANLAADGSCEAEGDLDDLGGQIATGQIEDGAVTPAKAAAALKTHTLSWGITDPATGDSDALQWLAPAAATITAINCSTDSGTVDIQLEERALATPNTAGTDVMSAALECDSDNAQQTSFSNAGIASGALLSLTLDAVDGASMLRVHVTYAMD